MQSNPRERLMHYADLLQGTLFTVLETALGPLCEKTRLLIAVLKWFLWLGNCPVHAAG
jgi:hypothetical protein